MLAGTFMQFVAIHNLLSCSYLFVTRSSVLRRTWSGGEVVWFPSRPRMEKFDQYDEIGYTGKSIPAFGRSIWSSSSPRKPRSNGTQQLSVFIRKPPRIESSSTCRAQANPPRRESYSQTTIQFGLELVSPDNIWGVLIPPEDWQAPAFA